MSEAKTLGQAAANALTAVAPSPEQSTRASTISETERKRAFLETFRRWEALFKRKDSGDVQAEKWLIAEYYDSLGHLSPEGLNRLTKMLKETCIFFPSIKECLDLIRPKDRYDFTNPFILAHRGQASPLILEAPSRKALAADRIAQLAGPSTEQ